MESVISLPLLFHVDTTMPKCTPSEPSPNIGRGHHRQLSTSAKWASNQALSLEYLKRQSDILIWIEKVLKRKMPSKDLYEVLKSGVILRELLETLYPETTSVLSSISRKYTPLMAPWKERENISVFLKQCKALGMSDFSLFCTDDLYEGTNMVQVLFGLQSFASFAQEQLDHMEEDVTSNQEESEQQQQENEIKFPHQEVENALSKIESAAEEKIATLQSLLAPPVLTAATIPADYTQETAKKDFSLDQIVATLAFELEVSSNNTSTISSKLVSNISHEVLPEESLSASSRVAEVSNECSEVESLENFTIQVEKEVPSDVESHNVPKHNETKESDTATCIVSTSSYQDHLNEDFDTFTDTETEVVISEQDTIDNTNTSKEKIVALSKKLQSELVHDEVLSASEVSSCACGIRRCSIM